MPQASMEVWGLFFLYGRRLPTLFICIIYKIRICT